MSGNHKERLTTSRELVVFLNKYSEVVERQLEGVRAMIEQAVVSVMQGVQEISTATSSEANQADQILEKAYLSPDQQSKELFDSIQNSVDQVFNEAKGLAATDASQLSSSLVDDRLRRFGGQFSKHMEALSTLDKDLSNLLLNMMGALSNDDVIRQKLEHLLACVHALQVGLSYVLLDFGQRISLKEVQALKADLLTYTYQLYSSEEEKELFCEIFGSPPQSPQDGKTRFAS